VRLFGRRGAGCLRFLTQAERTVYRYPTRLGRRGDRLLLLNEQKSDAGRTEAGLLLFEMSALTFRRQFPPCGGPANQASHRTETGKPSLCSDRPLPTGSPHQPADSLEPLGDSGNVTSRACSSILCLYGRGN